MVQIKGGVIFAGIQISHLLVPLLLIFLSMSAVLGEDNILAQDQRVIKKQIPEGSTKSLNTGTVSVSLKRRDADCPDKYVLQNDRCVKLRPRRNRPGRGGR
ncbi:hypothetical protein PTTG_28505 [Puccinia triticina 1-1 BBBD Race 1]|uniref:Uncharacterized protein n=2 Tax=Puccinia triticina TaxID=208348 RepID=A0A180GB99_PUCT1|nr:uncharacterized protein PtA15_4A445 [Puccinia triticina]OAV89911.1 hypothetical protein PTTG_28505 [Puccinia triticina 1-1 BBBD Race 1]WAQ83994.1 hypothetical protein PtA15_4A445 [Puccinia triticina]